MHWLGAAVLYGLGFICCATWAIAQEVTLRSQDGTLEISGDLLGFDGQYYRIDSQYGELTVDGARVACTGTDCPDLKNFVAEVAFSGSDTIARMLLPALISDFAQANEFSVAFIEEDEEHFVFEFRDLTSNRLEARFRVRATNTDEGFADLLAYETDFVMARREIRPDEAFMVQEAGFGDLYQRDQARVVALDAAVAIVSPTNPVTAIQPMDLALVFAGRITNWSELGGADAPIALHMLDAQAGHSQAIEDHLFVPARLTVAPEVQRHRDGAVMARTVAADPQAIAIASFAEIGSARVLALKDACGVQMPVNRQTLQTEDYPLATPIFFYLPQRRLPKLGRLFLAYNDSPEAQTAVRQAGFIDQATETAAFGARLANAVLAANPTAQLEGMQDLVSELSPMQRLSLSIRFAPGSTQPTAQSEANIRRLAQAFDAGDFAGRRMLIAGFADAAPQDVIRAVLNATKQGPATRPAVETQDFGDSMPLFCSDGPWGQKINRRVEIWLNHSISR